MANTVTTTVGWWTTIWQASRSVGLGLAAGLVTWLICLPIAMSLAFEQLQQHILKKRQIAAPGESMVSGVINSARSLLSGLRGQIIWIILTFVLSWIMPPLAIFTGAWSIAHALCRESFACCLTLCGMPYAERKRQLYLQQHGILFEGLSAAILKALLMITVIGWLFWLPSVFCGCAPKC